VKIFASTSIKSKISCMQISVLIIGNFALFFLHYSFFVCNNSFS
jgi:hypothetical protein